MRKFFCARSKKKGEIDVTLPPQKGKKKGENSEILFSLCRRRSFFRSSFSLSLKKTRKTRKGTRGENRGKWQILFLKRIRYTSSSQITTLFIIIFSFSLSLSLLSIYYFS